MKNLLSALLFLCTTIFVNAQSSESPYTWDWTRDGIWTGAALAGSAGGFILIQNKEGLTDVQFAEVLNNKENINFLDQWVAGKSSETASKISDIPFALSFATPFVLMFDDETNDHTAQVAGLYLESLATTASLYTLSAGLINRSRPYVYSDEPNLERRKSGSGQRSFFSGHVAATATATFFAAKVFSDFNPDAEGKLWIWAGAATLPAAVGYLRIEAGQHFITDVLLGYGIGAITGYFVPELHKTKSSELSIYPSGGLTPTGEIQQGMAMRITF